MKKKILIIGGGISGVYFASLCSNKGYDVTVLEAKEGTGGCINTVTSNSIWLEMGAHSVYNTYNKFQKLIPEHTIKNNLIPRNKLPFFVYKDQIASIFSQINLFELITYFLRSRFIKKDKTRSTVYDYYSNLFGKKNFNNLISHFFNAVLSQETKEFPASHVFRRKKRNKLYPKSFTFRGGLASLLTSVEEDHQITIKGNSKVVSIDKNGNCYKICTDSKVYEANILVVAIPPKSAGKILGRVNADLADRLVAINQVRIESVGVVISRDLIDLSAFGGIVGLNQPFFSVVSMDNVLPKSENKRGFIFHFKPNSLSFAEKCQKISDVLNVDVSSFEHIFKNESVLPSLGSDHVQSIEKIKQSVTDDSLYLIGNYFIGMSIEDCCERARNEFDRLINCT